MVNIWPADPWPDGIPLVLILTLRPAPRSDELNSAVPGWLLVVCYELLLVIEGDVREKAVSELTNYWVFAFDSLLEPPANDSYYPIPIVSVSSAELTCGRFISTGTSTLIEKVGGVNTGYDTLILIDESPRVGVLSAFDITGT